MVYIVDFRRLQVKIGKDFDMINKIKIHFHLVANK